jgi:hypothetical protein
MQVFARVRQRDFARLGWMLEMVMASSRADKVLAIRLKLPNDITRVFPQETPPN